MLEVYRREILDNVAARNAGIEKVLRLFDESDNSEKYCQLRGDWERTEVEHGDIVNIIGEAIVYLFSCYFLAIISSISYSHRTQNNASCYAGHG